MYYLFFGVLVFGFLCKVYDVLDSNKIKDILNRYIEDATCKYGMYEEARGIWCRRNLEWCSNMSGKSKKKTCPDFKLMSAFPIAQDILELLEQYEARIQELENKLDNIEANDYY